MASYSRVLVSFISPPWASLRGSNSGFVDGLSTELLLAAMNYLDTVQRFIEDRKMLLNSEEALSQLLVGSQNPQLDSRNQAFVDRLPGGSLFGESMSPEGTINWRDQEIVAIRPQPPDVLLDDTMSVIPKIPCYRIIQRDWTQQNGAA
jgi:hypothetical protein